MSLTDVMRQDHLQFSLTVDRPTPVPIVRKNGERLGAEYAADAILVRLSNGEPVDLRVSGVLLGPGRYMAHELRLSEDAVVLEHEKQQGYLLRGSLIDRLSIFHEAFMGTSAAESILSAARPLGTQLVSALLDALEDPRVAQYIALDHRPYL